jgi:hypothetical protein
MGRMVSRTFGWGIRRKKTYLGFDGRGDVLVWKDGAHARTEPAYDADWRLGEADARTCRDNARQLRDAILGIVTRSKRQD